MRLKLYFWGSSSPATKMRVPQKMRPPRNVGRDPNTSKRGRSGGLPTPQVRTSTRPGMVPKLDLGGCGAIPAASATGPPSIWGVARFAVVRACSSPTAVSRRPAQITTELVAQQVAAYIQNIPPSADQKDATTAAQLCGWDSRSGWWRGRRRWRWSACTDSA